ncbi:TPA: protoglobin domain-containing protein [Pseudomonas aeruginosa]
MQTSDKNLATFFHIGGLSGEKEEFVCARLLPLLDPHLVEITEKFYDLLLSDDQTAPYLEGRIESLKATHVNWIREMLSGVYDEAFMRRQEIIGEVHVKMRVPPHFVSSSMSHLRSAIPGLIGIVENDPKVIALGTKQVLQVLDLCQYLIDRKYNETLMDNLGIKPVLLERLQTLKRS